MRKQEKTIIAVIGIDILSIAVKFILASVTGSLSLLADAWHSISDLSTSILVLIALLLDRAGLARASETQDDLPRPRIIRRSAWEPRVCTVIGIALIGVAAGVFKKIYIDSTATPLRQPLIAVLIVLFLILLSYLRYRFEDSVGRETASPALVADAFHSRADIYVLALVLASFAGELLQIRIDRWIAGIIALMIFILAVKTIVRSLFMLFRLSAGTAPEDRTVEDAVIMLTMGGLTSGLSRITGRLTAMLNLTDPVIRRRWLRRSIGGVSGLAVTAWLATGIYTVSPSDVAIEEIVGKAVNRDRPSGPGLHVTWPVPFGRVRHVDTRTVRSMRLGYQLKDRGDLILWTNAHYIIEYAVLSGDGAILDLAANLHYRVIDPAAFLYGVASPVESLEMLANQVLREMAGSREAFSLLTVDRRGQEQAVLHTIQTVADQVNLGVEILAICLLDMHPPIDVAPAYEDVVSAQEDLETFVEEARGYEKEMLPLARAEAVVKRTEAAAYGTGQILRAKGRVAAFKVRNEAFKRHESINRYRMRMDNLAVGLAGAEIVLVDPGQVQRPLDLIVTRNFAPETAPMIVSPGGAGAEGEAYREP